MFTKFRTVLERKRRLRDGDPGALRPEASTVTRLEYLDIQPAKIDDSIFTPDGAKAM